MEAQTLITTHQSIPRDRFFAAVGPVLWIAISYVDPGKWATAVEGGARFGFDLVFLVLIVSFATMLWQYLSALIPIATGRNLPQICREEYDDVTCILLGIQAEISLIVLDLTMVLGTAYGLHTVFGIDLFNCVFLTGIDAVLFPFLTQLLENPKAKTFSICLACFILASYVSGVLISQPENSLSEGGIFNKLTGENAYVFMSILGANIMPHNFYLHSSIVQLDQGKTNVSKGELCRDHFFATFCVFSGIFLVNCMLMNLASSVFYSSEVTSLTLQDALSLLDQGYRSSLTSVALIFILYFSNQLVAVTWSLEREVIAHNFFGLEIPGWLHRATIRIIAIIPALSCVWCSGAEGIFQLLIFTQVIVALSLPSSVIPLFRVASSRPIMGECKMSPVVESLAIISFIGMLGLNVVFIMELVFGSSDWVSSLKWNVGSRVPISYLILLIAATGSLCLMLWLAITPLKSASSAEALALKWDKRAFAVDSLSTEGEPTEITESLYQLENTPEKQDLISAPMKAFGNQQNLSTATLDLDIPETPLHSDIKPQVKTLDSEPGAAISGIISHEPSAVDKSEPLDISSFSTEPDDALEKTLKIEGDALVEKDDRGDPWEPEELTKDVSENGPPSFTSEGPGSFRSLVEKTDDIGSGTGSISRLAGLGRAARRQLTAILDEFWGQLFDFHGQTTNEAKAKKLDVLLGVQSNIESKSSFPSSKVDGINKESNGYPVPGGRGLDNMRNTLNSALQNVGQNNMGSPLLAAQLGSPVMSDRMKQLGWYMQSPSNSFYGSDERRFHSLHIPSPSDGHDLQPATIHGYNIGSYLRAMDKAPDQLKDQLDLLTQAQTQSIKPKSMESNAPSFGQKPQNGSSRPVAPPGFPSVPVRNTLKSERQFFDLGSSESTENSTTSPNVKKYHSLPGVPGLSFRERVLLSDNNSQLYNPSRYGNQYHRPMQMNQGASLSGFYDLSPPKVQKDPFSLYSASRLHSGSLWSKQPYEHFGVAERTPKSQAAAVSVSVVDMEAKLLQSFRSCILKLLKLEGSDWLFKQNGGADEDLIDRIAARERFKYEVEVESMGEERKAGFAMKIDEIEHSRLTNCGDECVWRVDLIISFGVWCIHRILEFSLVESRPELWGKYTYVLNRLQGIIDLAFSKQRAPTAPCFCLDLPNGYQQKSSSSQVLNGGLPPPSKLWRGKLTSAAMLVDIVKDVELAISCRRGKTGTTAGDVAFPKGKENLASVLKRYKRRLSNKL